MIILLLWLLFGMHKANNHCAVVPARDLVSQVTVTVKVPLKGLDKKQAQEAGMISKDVAKDDDKAVLASGHIADDSGSREVSAVLNVKDGQTQIVEKRPFMEKMNRFEIGIGYGFESGDTAKVGQFRATVGRVDRVYFTGQIEVFDVDRTDNRHPWNAVALVNLRF